MAEYIVGPATEVAKCIAEPIKREFKYLCCFNTNIQNLRGEAKKLDDAKEGLQGQVDTASRNNDVIVPQVKTWLDDVSKIQTDMSGIETDILNVKSGCLAIKSRFLLSRKATKMAAAMKELQDDRGNFGQICHPPPPPAMASSIPVGQTYELETRKHFEDKIMAALREKKVNMMGICGMGGVGKTTTAKKIMSRAREESLFDEIVMVVVSQPIVTSSIQKQLFDSLGLEWKDESESNASYRLRSRLTNNKSILIVFDDLWEALITWEDLGIPDQKECTILLTSRSVDVFRRMGVEKPYQFQMKILNNIEALSLFKEKVGARADDPRLSPIAEKIVWECQGLPLALVTVGLALKDEENKAIWENAEQELTTCNPDGIPDYIEKVYNPLRLSYDKLGNNEHAKSMFLLCCLFPEDHEICISYLGLYTWGLDMFKGIKSLRAARNKVQASVKTLKSRSLLLDGSYDEFTKMHDVVRDVGIFIAEKQGLMNPPNWQGEDRHCTWISLFDAQKITLPQGSAFPKLQFLLIEGLYSSPKEELPLSDNFFESAENLHVLSIRNYSLRCLPHTIKLLKNLRNLILIRCYPLEDISVVGELVSLEILYCFNCRWIKELPVEIGRLNQLKLLHIEGCWRLNIAAGVISKLISLEELTLINSFSRWEWEASEAKKNAALCELNNLSRLTTLRIEIEDASLAAQQIHLPNVVEFNITIGMNNPLDAYERTTYGRAMQLKLERDGNIGDWIHNFSRSSERLTLRGEGSSKLIILDKAKLASLSDGNSNTTGFSLLEFLVLEDIDNLEELYRGPISSDSFKNLKEITLQSLPKLQQLGNVVPFFCNLSSIYIEECHSLRRLFPWAMGNNSLLRLESLTVKSCSMLEVMWDEEDGKEIGESSRITFPNLEKLILFDLPRLTTLCKGINSAEFPALTQMEINKCPNLKSLVSDHRKCWDDDSLHLFCKSDQVAFGRLEELVIDSINNLFSLSIATNLVNLIKLSIQSCPKMEQVMLWNEEELNGESSRITFPKLENLRLRDLPRLTSFCKGIQSIEFPLLTEMSITQCPNLKSVVSSSENDHICSGAINHDADDSLMHLFCKSQAAFGSLEYLTIGGYENSISERSWSLWCDQIPVNFFIGLVHLIVSNCGNIKSLFSASIAGNLVNLETLRIISCCEMVKVIEDEDEVERSPFINLDYLYLEKLPKLKAFCDWRCALHLPSLIEVHISECPEMERFSFGSLTTPNLKWISKNREDISDYTKDLNDAVTWDRDSLHLDILFGVVQ